MAYFVSRGNGRCYPYQVVKDGIKLNNGQFLPDEDIDVTGEILAVHPSDNVYWELDSPGPPETWKRVTANR